MGAQVLQGGSSASVGGGVQRRQGWYAAGSSVGRQAATVVAAGQCGCEGEGAGPREGGGGDIDVIAIVLQKFDEWEKRKRNETHLSWRAVGPMCACDACEGGCNGVAGIPAKGGVVT